MVELTVADGIAQIALTRADARNAVSPAWVLALADAVTRCEGRDDIRVILIRAEGPAFSVGGDLDHFAATIEQLPAQLEQMISRYHATLLTLAELPLPVVCAAHGAIAGGGLGLLWCSDVVLLAENAKLATGFARLGLSGDGGSSWYLPRLVGLRRATQLIMRGRVLSAQEALDWGLADGVVAAEELVSEAIAVAQSLAAGPTHAYGEMRRLIRRSFDVSLQEGLDAERRAIVRLGATDDAREGILAFGERREPRFHGR